jgi:L-alanine-DL-glutamate epimerase-like enolase superfamily enzyme
VGARQAHGEEVLLDALESPIPIAADESVQTCADIAALAGRFEVINIKHDKCGGLTEALEMAQTARKAGLGVMVGNMLGTSQRRHDAVRPPTGSWRERNDCSSRPAYIPFPANRSG